MASLVDTYDDLKVFNALAAYPTVPELMAQYSAEFLVEDFGPDYGLDLATFLNRGFYTTGDIEKIREYASNYREKILKKYKRAVQSAINVRSEYLAIVLELQNFIEESIANDRQYFKDWEPKFSELLQQTRVAFLVPIYQRVYEDQELDGFDVELLTMLKDDLIILDFEPFTEAQRKKRVLRKGFTDTLYDRFLLTQEDVYYVNEFEKIRFEADLNVCGMVKRDLDDFVVNTRNKSLQRAINDVIREFSLKNSKFSYRDIDFDQELKLFDIGSPVVTQEQKYALKNYATFFEAANLIDKQDWELIRAYITSVVKKKQPTVLKPYLKEIVDRITAGDQRFYKALMYFDMESPEKNYAIQASSFRKLYLCRKLIRKLIKTIAENRVYTAEIEQMFTDENVFQYYVDYYSDVLQFLLPAEQLDVMRAQVAERRRKLYAVEQMANYLVTEKEVQSIPEARRYLIDEIKDIEEYPDLFNAILEAVADLIVLVTFTSCKMCNKPAKGKCCNIGLYCSAKCQSTDWQSHKVHH